MCTSASCQEKQCCIAVNPHRKKVHAFTACDDVQHKSFSNFYVRLEKSFSNFYVRLEKCFSNFYVRLEKSFFQTFMCDWRGPGRVGAQTGLGPGPGWGREARAGLGPRPGWGPVRVGAHMGKLLKLLCAIGEKFFKLLCAIKKKFFKLLCAIKKKLFNFYVRLEKSVSNFYVRLQTEVCSLPSKAIHGFFLSSAWLSLPLQG